LASLLQNGKKAVPNLVCLAIGMCLLQSVVQETRRRQEHAGKFAVVATGWLAVDEWASRQVPMRRTHLVLYFRSLAYTYVDHVQPWFSIGVPLSFGCKLLCTLEDLRFPILFTQRRSDQDCRLVIYLYLPILCSFGRSAFQ